MPSEENTLSTSGVRRQSGFEGWSKVLLPSLILIVLGAIALTRLPLPDVAIQLHAAGALLDGARYGHDLLEINPPLFAWLAVPIVVVSRLTSSWVGDVFVVTFTIVLTFCLLLSLRLLRAEQPIAKRLVGMAVPVAMALALVFPGEFGQREHLIFAFLLPYVLLASLRAQQKQVSRTLVALCSVLAAVAVSLKPHFVFVPLLLEIRLLVVHGVVVLRRPEPWIIAGVGLAYLAAVLLLTPDYLPFVQDHAAAYVAFHRQPMHVVLLAAPLQLTVLVSLFAALLFTNRCGTIAETTRTLSLAVVGAMMASAAQGKVFLYHFLPAHGFAMLVLFSIALQASEGVQFRGRSRWQRILELAAVTFIGGWYFADIYRLMLNPSIRWEMFAMRVAVLPVFLVLLRTISADSLAWPRLRAATMSVATLMCIALASLTVDASFGRPQPVIDPLLPRLAEVLREKPGESIAIMSTNPASYWPLLLLVDARWPFRYTTLGFPAAFYPVSAADGPKIRTRSLQERTGTERLFTEIVVEDLVRERPGLIITVASDRQSVSRIGAMARYDFLDYLSVDPRFQSLMGEYEERQQVGYYRVFERKLQKD